MFWSVSLWPLPLSLSGYFHRPQDPSSTISKVTATSFSCLPPECCSVSGLRLSLSLQSGHVPEHLTRGLPSMEPMLSPGCAALLCPLIYRLSHPRQTRLTDPHHPCSHHRPACLWESLLHTSWSSFQIHLFVTGG